MSACLLALTGCHYDDTDLWDRVNDHEERLSDLEEQAVRMNGQIAAMNQIVTALEEGDMITGVTPLPDGGGYTITFRKGAPITVRNGENGEDGQTPIIGVREVDGIFYWTLNGEFLTDENGNRVPATGNAVAPQIRINQTTLEWEISTDGGTTWNSTGIVAVGPEGPTGPAGPAGPAGQDGDSLFSDVNVSNPEFVIFTLADGTTIRVPRLEDLGLNFIGLTNNTFRFPADGQVNNIQYTVTGNIAGIGIASTVPQGWTVTVNSAANRIEISTLLAESIQVLVVATSADGESVSYWLTLTAFGINLQAMIDAAVAAGGGTVTLEPAMTYSLGTGVTIPAGVVIEGGQGTVLGFPDAVDGNAVTINGGTLRNVTVRYMPARTPGAAWTNNPAGVAFAIGGAGGTLENSTVTGFRNGVYANNTAGVSVLNNTIEANRTGIQFANKVGGQVSGNTIRNNETVGFLLQFLSEDLDRGTLTIGNNTFSANWYSDVENRWTTEYIINLNNNTFTATPPTLVVAPNSGEPGSDVTFTIPTPAPNTANIVTGVRTNVVIDSVTEVTP